MRSTIRAALVAAATLAALTLGTAPAWATDEPPAAEVTVAPVVLVDELALYLYQKLDREAPASFANSGEQTLIAVVPGSSWFVEYPGELPPRVCGPGWAVQQDHGRHDGSFVWPLTITAPSTPLSDAGVLVKARHLDLELLASVPACEEPEPTPTPTPTPPVEATPTPTPPAAKLAATGFDPLAAGGGAALLLLAGIAARRASTLARN